MSTDNSSVLVEEGFDLSDAWGLPTPPVPERQIDKLILQCGDYLGDLDKLASSSGAKETADRADKYRKELVDITKKAAKNKKEAKLVKEAVELLVKIRGELAVPAREEGVNKALAEFKLHAGPLGKTKASEFEKSRDKVAKEKDAVKRCEAYYDLEREIIRADLYFQEQANPGSTWQTQVEFAVSDAHPDGDSKKKKSPLTLDEWKQIGQSFAASLQKKIDDMAFSVAPDDVDDFKKEALAAIKEVQEEYFSDERLPENQQKLGKALMVANMSAMQALSTLKRDYPPDTTPQVFVKDGKMTVAKQAPKLESLVLQGGGGKGVGYPAMLEEMNKSGMLDSVDLLVGTSIGALNASCLACGGLEDEREILNIGVTKQAVSSWRNGTAYFGNPEAIRIAKLLNFDPAYVMACANAERSRTDEERAIWERVARSVAANAAGVAVVGAGLSALPSAVQAGQVCILCKTTGRRPVGYLSDLPLAA